MPAAFQAKKISVKSIKHLLFSLPIRCACINQVLLTVVLMLNKFISN